MKPLKLAAIVLFLIATILTGVGGWLDLYGESSVRITKQHAWNDGLFLAIVAVFLLLL
jgi:hypothetical protein